MKLDIEYNTARPDIEFPEYGRTIQEMIQHAKTIPIAGQRQKTVESIINLMIQVGPQGNRNMEDYREKLWNHVFAVANYELDVTPPPNVLIRKEEERPKPVPVGYPASSLRMRHYGNSVHALIQKAIEMPDGVKKEGLVEVIASYMKLAYKTWNREHYVSDDIVKDDLVILSGGKLSLHEGHDSLDKLAAGANISSRRQNRSNNNERNNRGSGKNNNSGRNRKGGNTGDNYRKRKK
jgi:Domain of unknown function (DUF4290)